MAWYDKIGPESDVVVSSRVRLARNLEGYPFPSVASDAQNSEMIGEVSKALAAASLSTVDPIGMSPVQIHTYVEKHYISPEFAAASHPRALLLDEKQQIAVMVGEEDHVRIQALASGLALSEAYETARRVDELLDSDVKIAYSETLGYLTHCPTNLGTAMRASVMLHLPALKLAGKLPALIRNLTKLGMTVRGIYGEGSESCGALYQISNSVTLGVTEKELIEKLEGAVRRIIDSERKLRDSMKSDRYASLCDRVMRAKGVLTGAYMLNVEEFMELWSNVRFGAAMGLLEGVTLPALNTLLMDAKPAGLTAASDVDENTPSSELAILRAKLARERLA